MTRPSFAAIGPYINTSTNGAVAWTYPTVAAGKRFIAQFRGGATSDVVLPTGWTAIIDNEATAGNCQGWIFYRDALSTGSDSTINFTLDSPGTQNISGMISAWSDVSTSIPFWEDLDKIWVAGTSALIHQPVTASGNERLAVCMSATHANTSAGEFAGETGSTWTRHQTEQRLFLDSAPLDNGQTIADGSVTIGGTDIYAITFALLPVGAAAPASLIFPDRRLRMRPLLMR